MVVFGIGIGCGFLVRSSDRGDPQGVPSLSFYCASRWHEDVSRSTLPVLLEGDEETRRRLRSTMPHMSAGKGCAPNVTPQIIP